MTNISNRLDKPPRLRALLWDVDGTLAETEPHGHLPAFNHAFRETGLPWHWSDEEYERLLDITGGRERIQRYAEENDPARTRHPDWPRQLDQLYRLKTQRYAVTVACGAITLRPGVLNLIREAHQAGCKQAIVTTTAASNVAALLSHHIGTHWRDLFSCLVCGEDVAEKKPHPEAYLKALQELALPAESCLAIEDSPNGFIAARKAGLACLITRSHFFPGNDYDDALVVCEQLPVKISFAELAQTFSSHVTI
ncbi:MAG: HAD-IA family hydrolase [Formivibrio sp.]|nr:HAD-IA family hydrolase [Formivibrio sp.]